MSDTTYKRILDQQRGNKKVRTQVNEFLQSNINEDIESLQALVMDSTGDFLPVPDGGWHADRAKFFVQLDKAKEDVYLRILTHIHASPIKRNPTCEVDDPTEPVEEEEEYVIPAEVEKPKPRKTNIPIEQDDIARSINTLLKFSSSMITEDRVRDIVREELSKAMKGASIELNYE